jgi:predicted Fe-S protein YdhL (DUF1289 family)
MTPARPVSPCIDVCALDASRTCVGCRRTLDEIARWGGMSAAEQWQVIDRLERARQREAEPRT